MSKTNISTPETSSNRNSYGESISFEYILAIDDFGFDSFLKDSRTRAVASKTNCHVELTTRILNKRINLYRWTKYAIIKVTGPDEGSINQCLRLIERQFPIFLHRKEYSRRANVTIFTNELSFPDNVPGQPKMVRSGSTMSSCQGLAVKSPFVNDDKRTSNKTRWKTKKSEKEGRYTSALQLQKIQQPPLYIHTTKLTSFDSASTKFSSNEIFGLLGTLASSDTMNYSKPAGSDNVTVRVSLDNVDKLVKESQTAFEKVPTSEDLLGVFGKGSFEFSKLEEITDGAEYTEHDLNLKKKEFSKLQSKKNSLGKSVSSVDQKDDQRFELHSSIQKSKSSTSRKSLLKLGLSSRTSLEKLQYVDEALLGKIFPLDRNSLEEGDQGFLMSLENVQYDNEVKEPITPDVTQVPDTTSYISCRQLGNGKKIRERYAHKSSVTKDRNRRKNFTDKRLKGVLYVGDEYDCSSEDDNSLYEASNNSIKSLQKHTLQASMNILQREFQTLVGGSPPENDNKVSVNVGVRSMSSSVNVQYTNEGQNGPNNDRHQPQFDNDIVPTIEDSKQTKGTIPSKTPRRKGKPELSSLNSVSSQSSCDRFNRHHSKTASEDEHVGASKSPRGRKNGLSNVHGDRSRKGESNTGKPGGRRRKEESNAGKDKRSKNKREADEEENSRMSLNISVHSDDSVSEVSIKADIGKPKNQHYKEPSPVAEKGHQKHKSRGSTNTQEEAGRRTTKKNRENKVGDSVVKRKDQSRPNKRNIDDDEASEMSVSVNVRHEESASEINIQADRGKSKHRQQREPSPVAEKTHQKHKSRGSTNTQEDGARQTKKNRQGNVGDSVVRRKDQSRTDKKVIDDDVASELSVSVSVHSDDNVSEVNIKTDVAKKKPRKHQDHQKHDLKPIESVSAMTEKEPARRKTKKSLALSVHSSGSFSETSIQAEISHGESLQPKDKWSVNNPLPIQEDENELVESVDTRKEGQGQQQISINVNFANQISVSVTYHSVESANDDYDDEYKPTYASESVSTSREQNQIQDNPGFSPASSQVSVSIVRQLSNESSQSVSISISHAGQVRSDQESPDEESVSPIVPTPLDKAKYSSTSISISSTVSSNVARPQAASQVIKNQKRTTQTSKKPIKSGGTVHRSISISHDEGSTTLSYAMQKGVNKDSEQISTLLEMHRSTKSSEGLVYMSDYQKNEMEFKLGDVKPDPGRLTVSDQKAMTRREPTSKSRTDVSIQKVSGIKLSVSVSHSSIENPNGVYVKGINDHPTSLLSKADTEVEESNINKMIIDKLRSPMEGPLIIMFEGRNIYTTGTMSLAIRPTGDSIQSLNYEFESSNYAISVKAADPSVRNVNARHGKR